ncbi:Polysaccharide biosynthesis/export protein [Microbulbifer aggregans]|uniref:Polysaccharide biosynthesis/export protein n=1 Tax=Microbulbifer aggregans TaxID=1769779 RepID=A0A1C9W5R9_9GAMM|nr:polysaccharide biosynthesis/export family protein [Microbulbifer aggregans]AOS96491.1 Polysaccharide biosynthesis/export protein [Microbulbifer aggregans]
MKRSELQLPNPRYLLLAAALCLAPLPLMAETDSKAPLKIANYQLDSGDRIAIRVFGEEDLSMEMYLGDSGVINYPFIGEIDVTGLNTSELERKIVAGLRGDYLINPSVEVTIVEYRPFFINGEVTSPGSYTFHPGLTINKAVAMASGFTPRASEQKITVERGQGEKKRTFKAELDTRLLPGDIVTVEQGIF